MLDCVTEYNHVFVSVGLVRNIRNRGCKSRSEIIMKSKAVTGKRPTALKIESLRHNLP